ncbi:MAG: alpha/beta fold hydrolase [Candidatus Eremiobacteraeota bacterium]|nr:alpha/beta fold hydrolase [Candidatus Eremiobacteraeota bacterium]
MQVFGDDGACIDVRVDGDGADAVVLIHGFPLTRDVWDAQAETLARTHRVVRPDLRGMGASSVPDGPYLMEVLASDVAAMLDALGIERAALAGHSLGGYASLAFARMYAERVSHLALVCSRIVADTPEIAKKRRETAEKLERGGTMQPEMVLRLLAPQTQSHRPEIVRRALDLESRVDPRGAASMLRGMAMRVAADDIAGDLDAPVLILAGAQDSVISMEEARTTAGAFPKGRLVVCQASGHLPMLEEPQKVTEALQEWLAT